MSAHPKRIDRKSLKERADYFFTSRAYLRGEVQAFARELQDVGPAVVIGGILRDLCLGGVRGFRSDVDFVVDATSDAAFERFVARHGGKRNRFGGHAIVFGLWHIDVWPLSRTWAAVHGHERVESLDDLTKVTFFDWDAVIYSLGDQRIATREGYFERLRSRTIEINLEPNPNPLGNAVRALRYAAKWEAKVGTTLAAHVCGQIADKGWTRFVDSECKSFSNPILGEVDGERVQQLLKNATAPVDVFDRRQGELTLV